MLKVHSKGDQPWVFFGRNYAKAETLVLWPPDAKSCLIWKDPDAGQDWRQERGQQRMRPNKTFSSVQSLSRVQLLVTPWITAHQASLSFTNSQSSPKLMAIEPVMPSSHLILCGPLLLLPPSLPTSGSFLVSQLFVSGGQSIGVSASVLVLPINIQDWSPLGLNGWIFLQSKELSRVFSKTTVQKHQFFGAQLSSQSNSHIIYDHWKNQSLDETDLCWQSNVSAF